MFAVLRHPIDVSAALAFAIWFRVHLDRVPILSNEKQLAVAYLPALRRPLSKSGFVESPRRDLVDVAFSVLLGQNISSYALGICSLSFQWLLFVHVVLTGACAQAGDQHTLHDRGDVGSARVYRRASCPVSSTRLMENDEPLLARHRLGPPVEHLLL